MLESSRQRRVQIARRRKQRWAQRLLHGALCAAGWLAGPALLQAEPQAVLNEYFAAKSAVTASEDAPADVVPATAETGLVAAKMSDARPTLVEARPLALESAPAKLATPSQSQLAPIVSAAAMKRPGIKPVAASSLAGTKPAAVERPVAAANDREADASRSPTNWMGDVRQALETTAAVPPAPPARATPAVPVATNSLAPIVSSASLKRAAPSALADSKPAPGAAEATSTRTAPGPGLVPAKDSGSSASSNWMGDVRQALETTPAAKPAKSVAAAPVATNDLAPIVSSTSLKRARTEATSTRTAPGPGLVPAKKKNVVHKVQTAQFDAADQIRLAAQPGVAPPAPLPAGPAISPVPPGSPFEVITESGTLTLRVRRSLLMRTKVDVYRTAVVDESVCDVVQFTPREISLIGRAQGSTHITFWFDDPATPPLTYLVKVEPDADVIRDQEYKYQMLEDLVNEMFPDSKIRLEILADKLLVKGQCRDSQEAAQIMTIIRAQGGGFGGGPGWGGVGDVAATGVIPAAATGLSNQPTYQLINLLRVPGVQQVALKVKIGEMNRTAARGFGVNLKANIDLGDNGATNLFLASLLSPSSGSSVIANVSGDDLNVGIRYLQEHGVLRLMSEPTLVTLSGKPATFVAGGEFAVPTIVGSVGLNAVTTDFRAFGAIVSFLPTIVDKDRIRLQVSPEFSQINSGLSVGGTPGLTTRSATTTVEMREGQTLAIAGLLEENIKAGRASDFPFLGHIFGTSDGSRTETELIILVTPELVHPMEPEEVPPLPGFDITEPTPGEFLCGEIEGYPTREYRSTVWPQLRKRYGGPAMTSGPFGHGQ